ncbi:hypothetical protein NDU88_005920 [Pleurodeles waltl]|uniref:Uncharacterized protein n=1 Tax=Pleurodeles waltl TaxID=8319 RepID=A0AAV7PGT5_PLEWA|nr:hypothetical protein NDU88_005920 [Pleurodeles waltl]
MAPPDMGASSKEMPLAASQLAVRPSTCLVDALVEADSGEAAVSGDAAPLTVFWQDYQSGDSQAHGVEKWEWRAPSMAIGPDDRHTSNMYGQKLGRLSGLLRTVHWTSAGDPSAAGGSRACASSLAPPAERTMAASGYSNTENEYAKLAEWCGGAHLALLDDGCAIVF